MKKLLAVVTILVSLCASQAQALKLGQRFPVQEISKYQGPQDMKSMKKQQAQLKKDVQKYIRDGEYTMAKQALTEMSLYKKKMKMYENKMNAQSDSGFARARTTTLQ